MISDALSIGFSDQETGEVNYPAPNQSTTDSTEHVLPHATDVEIHCQDEQDKDATTSRIVKSFQGIKHSFLNAIQFRIRERPNTEKDRFDVKYQKLQCSNSGSDESGIHEVSNTITGQRNPPEEDTNDHQEPLEKMAEDTLFSIDVQVENYQKRHSIHEMENGNGEWSLDDVSAKIQERNGVQQQAKTNDEKLCPTASCQIEDEERCQENVRFLSLEKLATGNVQPFSIDQKSAPC